MPSQLAGAALPHRPHFHHHHLACHNDRLHPPPLRPPASRPASPSFAATQLTGGAATGDHVVAARVSRDGGDARAAVRRVVRGDRRPTAARRAGGRAAARPLRAHACLGRHHRSGGATQGGVSESPPPTLPPPRPPPTPLLGAATSGVRGGPRRSRALPWERGAAHVRPSRCPGGGKGATRAPPPCQMAQWVQWPNGPIGPLAQGGPYVVAKPCALAGHVRVRFRVTPPGGMHDGPSCYQPEGCSS